MGTLESERLDCLLEQDLFEERRYDKAILSRYIGIEKCVQGIVESENNESVARVKSCGDNFVVVLSAAGSLLRELLDIGCNDTCSQLNFFDSSSCFKAFHDAALWYEEDKRLDFGNAYHEAIRLNVVADKIRNAVDRRSLAAIRYRQNKAREKRFRSTSQYIDSIRSRYSRINCLRVDLGYRKRKFLESYDQLKALNEVKLHWDKMRLDLARGLPVSGMVGFVVRLEYGIYTGFHFHALIIMDGSKRQQDISLAQVIGEHWVNVIVPNFEGRYYNCNRYKNSYQYLGIGVINHHEDSKYAVLKNIVLNYMIKTDCLMDLISPGERSMFRGKNHQASLSVRGRPRKKKIQNELQSES